MKKQVTIITLLVIIVFSFSITASESVRLGYRYFAKDTISYRDIAGAKAGNIPVAPVIVTPNSSSAPVQTTPIETIFLAGGSSYGPANNNVISSNDGSSWNQLTAMPGAAFTPRIQHTLTFFNGYLWIMGGNSGALGVYTEYNDIYVSNDGANWAQLLLNAPWPTRVGHTVVSLNGKLFILGGSSFTAPAGPRTYLSDVWWSLDGVNWVPQFYAPWNGRWGHSSVVFNNKIWVIGGEGPTGQPNPAPAQPLSDVWSSPDGITWIQETANAPWDPRVWHSALVFNGKIYVMGGFANLSGVPTITNDVWSSVDGVNWIQETANAGWLPRMDHVSLVFDNEMWVIGGFDNTTYTDAWKSRDGITWTQQTTNIPNLHGYGFAGVVMP